jgi:S-DNA-T family DNA segregation ATPase FtsK/SpoIIIE
MVTTEGISCGARVPPPPFPTDDVTVDAPLVLPRAPAGHSRLVPILAVVAMVVTGALIWVSRSAVAPNPMTLMLPAMMVTSILGMAIQRGNRGAGGHLDAQRRQYLDNLNALNRQLREAVEQQRLSLTWMHPAPSALWTLAGGPRMWERSVADSDFGHVRLGAGTQRLCRTIRVPPIAPVNNLDPVTAEAFRRFVHTHATVADLPIALALTGTARVAVTGPPADVRALVRSMVCQLAVSHGPNAILVAAVVGSGRREHWDWLKWLPHNSHPSRGGPMVFDAGATVDDVPAEPGLPHLVLVIDGADCEPPVGQPGATIVVVGETRDENAIRLHLDGDCLISGGDRFARPDSMTLSEARVCARRLARYRPNRPVTDGFLPWAGDGWGPRSPRERLRVSLGASAAGKLVDLDIKEAAEGGDGPHGLCVGATGSGKSELLRTVVLGMVARHSPDELNLVLIDFKGGATFLGLDGLHHIAATITNLADEAHLVARANDALAGEMHRRQQVLRHAGNAVNLAAYRRIRSRDPSLPPLPSLLVVVDEFAELLHHHPDFAELFVMIGRLGRSLGVHLLLASQRLDEGRLRGLESHLSYRICLKTSTAADSRAVLGVPDAAELPTAPGAAYLRGADGRLARFQTAYLGAPAPAAGPDRVRSAATVRLFTSAPAAAAVVENGHRTLMDSLLERFAGVGPRAHQVWLPPLSRSPRLAELSNAEGPELTAAIGVIDRPFEQRRVPLVVAADGAGGHIAVVGAPQSGKSETVRTLVTALALRHDPRRIQFYCLDFGGGTLEALRALPHVGSVAARADHELVRRIVGHVETIMRSREAGLDDEYGDVFLVIDGWQTLREQFGDLEPTITGMAAAGLSFGIHVLLTAGRWADIRPGLKDQIGTRIELRLGDPLDSDMDRKQAALVPLSMPGRGVTRDGHHFTIATSNISDRTWPGSWRTPQVRLLPTTVDHASVLESEGSDGILLGIGESDLEPLAVDFGRQPHLLIVGDRECGKTATLRTLCLEIVRRTTPQHAELFVVDYRRTLLGIVDPARLSGYAFSSAALADQLPALVESLRRRLPAPDVTVEQLRARSWWSGPEVFVVVDDYDLVSAGTGDALAPLIDVLPQAADIGLHLVMARRCAGLARAMYDPILAHLRDSGCMTLLMSGSPEEGAIIGPHRAVPQPPGRGLLVSRVGAQRVQVGWCPP